MPLAKTLPSSVTGHESFGAVQTLGVRLTKRKPETIWKSVFRYQKDAQSANHSFEDAQHDEVIDGLIPFAPYIQVAKLPTAPTMSRQSLSRTKILQKWEGVVLHKGKELFQARLYEAHDDFPTKLANIRYDALTEEEQLQVDVGSRFVWTISSHESNGTARRESTIYFRRYVWDGDELIAARQKAETLCSNIAWE